MKNPNILEKYARERELASPLNRFSKEQSEHLFVTSACTSVNLD